MSKRNYYSTINVTSYNIMIIIEWTQSSYKAELILYLWILWILINMNSKNIGSSYTITQSWILINVNSKNIWSSQTITQSYWKNIKKLCKSNKLKISTPTWNENLELPNGSYSVTDIQDYFEQMIKNIKQWLAIL